MTHSEEVAERIIRKGFVRPLLAEAEKCRNEGGDDTALDWLPFVLKVTFDKQLPPHTDYEEVGRVIADCLDVPTFA